MNKNGRPIKWEKPDGRKPPKREYGDPQAWCYCCKHAHRWEEVCVR